MKSLAKRRMTKKQKERRRNFWLGLIAAAIVFIGGYISGNQDLDFSEVRTKLDEATANIERRMNELGGGGGRETPTAGAGTSQIHIFDVGQGAATLLIASDGTSILVDTGRYDDGEKRIVSYLDQHIGLGEELDLLIFTHNDSDHIGHGDLVLEYFDVQEVWMNGMDHTSRVYENLLDVLLETDVAYYEPKAGEYLKRGAFEIQVLHPAQDSPQSNSNDESIVTRFAFDGISLMSSGDASIPRENEIIKRGGYLQSDILMLGHHGAANSTGENWLDAVNPEMAFFQAGVDNSYGHPSVETLERLDQFGIPVYGTTELGTISLYLDAEGEITVETER